MSLTLNALESTPLHLMTHEEGVRFPEGALPHQSPVYVRNSLVILAAPSDCSRGCSRLRAGPSGTRTRKTCASPATRRC